MHSVLVVDDEPFVRLSLASLRPWGDEGFDFLAEAGDGAGIDPDRAARILDGKPEQGGLTRIGVANVHRRIRLNHGEPYGLEVESEPGAFTLVRYVLPALRRAEDAAGEAARV